MARQMVSSMSASDWRERLRKRAVASNISSGRAGININDKIYTAQIRALYQHTPMVLTVNVVNSALVALVLASYMEHTSLTYSPRCRGAKRSAALAATMA